MKGGQDVWSVLSRQTFKRRLADYYGAIIVDRNTAKEARLYDMKQYLIDRWTKLYWDSRNELRREAIRVDLKQFGTYGIAVLASIGALYWIAVSPSVNASPGLYTILFQAVSGILDPMYLIVLALRQLGESSGYASDLRHFLDLPEYSAPSADPTKNTRPFPKPLRQGIVVKNVTYTYPGSETPALHNLNLEINAGEKEGSGNAWHSQEPFSEIQKYSSSTNPLPPWTQWPNSQFLNASGNSLPGAPH